MKSVLRITALVLAAVYAAAAGAQSVPSRGGKWEFTLQPQYTHGKSFDTGHGSGGQTDSSLGTIFENTHSPALTVLRKGSLLVREN